MEAVHADEEQLPGHLAPGEHVDSTHPAVVASMADQADAPVKTCSIAVAEPGYDESLYAERAGGVNNVSSLSGSA